MIPETWKLHHIGYLISNMEKSISSFLLLGYEADSIFYDEERMADFCFLHSNSGIIELVAPKEESELHPLLKQYRNAPYHLCFEVEDLDESVGCLKSHGFLLFKDKQRANAISKTAQVVFLMHASLGIIELVSSIEE
ncbi:MAG: VOC family protein [Butyrivibrio sp.]|nr:VOC family protein [Butyrivibrio sp.]